MTRWVAADIGNAWSKSRNVGQGGLMRAVSAGTAIASAALIAISMTGVASAETQAAPAASTGAAAPSVSVEGVATVPLAQGASAMTATAAYRQAMAAAEADAHEKAEFLAVKAGVTLGGALSITEDGGAISCTGGEEGGYIEYTGEQPDFGESSVLPTPFERAAGSPSTAKPVAKHHHKRKRKPRNAATKHASAASASAAPSCSLSARVALAYTLG
jgi:hypothetical protein